MTCLIYSLTWSIYLFIHISMHASVHPNIYISSSIYLSQSANSINTVQLVSLIGAMLLNTILHHHHYDIRYIQVDQTSAKLTKHIKQLWWQTLCAFIIMMRLQFILMKSETRAIQANRQYKAHWGYSGHFANESSQFITVDAYTKLSTSRLY